MIKHLSLRMKLDDLVSDKDYEKKVLENIRRCSKLVGKFFKVVFWHDNLTEKQCKDFIKRNEKLLFEVNTKITKIQEKVWFLIGDGKGRYRFDGDILQGISEYLKIINHMNRRDNK